MAEVIGEAVIKVRADGTAVPGQVQQTGKTAGTAMASGFKSAFKGVLAAIGITTLGTQVVQFAKASIAEAREAQKTAAITERVIKTTGGAANVTAAQVTELSNALSKKVGIDDEVIQRAENMLLTFRKVRNEVGADNDIFDRATNALLDLSAAGFGSTDSAARMVGKALNDPIRGMTALARVGVTFTDQQKETIKKLVESNKILEAQKFILDEVEGRVSGLAEANATAGEKAMVAWQNVEEALGTALLPTLDDLANWFVSSGAPAMQEFIAQMRAGEGIGGEIADGLGLVVDAGKLVVDILGAIPGPVLELGIKVGIAALALNKLGGGFSFVAKTAPVATAATVEANAAAAASGTATAAGATGWFKLGHAIGALAAAGGLILAIDGLNDANKAVGMLKTTLGGAALGLARGGPVGAAVGAAAGAVGFLAIKVTEARKAARESLGTWQDYASTMDQVTGATTAATGAMAFQKAEEAGLVPLLNSLGISQRQWTQAVMSDGAARRESVAMLNAERAGLIQRARAVQNNTNMTQEARAAEESVIAARVRDVERLKAQIGASDAASAKLREQAAASREFSKAIQSLPKNVRTHIEAEGMAFTRKAIVDLVRQFDNLDRKDIAVLIRENGGKPTKEMIDRIIERANRLDKADPTTDIRQRGGEGVNKTLSENIEKGLLFAHLNPTTHIGERGGSQVRGTLGGLIGQASALSGIDPVVNVVVNAAGAAAALRAVQSAINGITRYISVTVDVVRHVIGGAIPGLNATGAVVNKPTLGVFGEAGAEAIVPLTPNAVVRPEVIRAVEKFAAERGIGQVAVEHRSRTFPSKVILRVGARDFVGYIEEIADDRIDAADTLAWQGA